MTLPQTGILPPSNAYLQVQSDVALGKADTLVLVSAKQRMTITLPPQKGISAGHEIRMIDITGAHHTYCPRVVSPDSTVSFAPEYWMGSPWSHIVFIYDGSGNWVALEDKIPSFGELHQTTPKIWSLSGTTWHDWEADRWSVSAGTLAENNIPDPSYLKRLLESGPISGIAYLTVPSMDGAGVYDVSFLATYKLLVGNSETTIHWAMFYDTLTSDPIVPGELQYRHTETLMLYHQNTATGRGFVYLHPGRGLTLRVRGDGPPSSSFDIEVTQISLQARRVS